MDSRSDIDRPHIAFLQINTRRLTVYVSLLAIGLLFGSVLLFSPVFVFAQVVNSVQAQITSSSDDAHDIPAGWPNYSHTSGLVYAGAPGSSGPAWGGWRWTNLNIPAGATITNAYVEFNQNAWGNGMITTLAFENDPNPATFSSNSSPFTRWSNKTTFEVDWSWGTSAPGSWIKTPSLSAGIQELVDRYGGVNTLVLLEDGTGVVQGQWHAWQSYDANPLLSANLYIEYTAGSVGPDTIPPSISNPQPIGTLTVSTTQATLQITTNEAATCRYSTTPGVAFSSMPNIFITTGGTSHSSSVTGLVDGSIYTYYVRCQDTAGNANTSDTVISFSVAILSSGAPYPSSDEITGVSFDWSIYQTLAPGSDIWPITWADDDNQYTSWGDGGGFGGTNNDGRVSLGFARVEGDFDNYQGFNVWGGKNAENPAQFDGKSFGIVSIDGTLYAWWGPGSESLVTETRVLESIDHAKSWTKSTWQWTDADDLYGGSFLNFGKDYAGARDNYVYSYFPRGSVWQLQIPGNADLVRVPKDMIMDQLAYEWFTGLDVNGNPTWNSDMTQRQPVFTDPNGVRTVSVTYDPGLGLYLLTNQHNIVGLSTDTNQWGLFEGPEPWGPWETVDYFTSNNIWGPPGGTFGVISFYFAPKWFSTDGKDFKQTPLISIRTKTYYIVLIGK